MVVVVVCIFAAYAFTNPRNIIIYYLWDYYIFVFHTFGVSLNYLQSEFAISIAFNPRFHIQMAVITIALDNKIVKICSFYGVATSNTL